MGRPLGVVSTLAASVRILGRGIIGPLRRLNNTANNEPHALAAYLLDPSSGDQSIELVSFHSADALVINFTKQTFRTGNGFFFLDLPLVRIVDQSAYPSPSTFVDGGPIVSCPRYIPIPTPPAVPSRSDRNSRAGGRRVNSLPAFARRQHYDFASVGHRLWSSPRRRRLPLVNFYLDRDHRSGWAHFRTTSSQYMPAFSQSSFLPPPLSPEPSTLSLIGLQLDRPRTSWAYCDEASASVGPTRLPFGHAAILTKLYACLSERIHHAACRWRYEANRRHSLTRNWPVIALRDCSMAAKSARPPASG